MGAFIYDKCCFCIELKTGCFIIGYLYLICYSIMALFGILFVVAGAEITKESSLPEGNLTSVVGSNSSSVDTDDLQAFGVAVTLFAALFILVVVVMITFVIVLLAGLHKNKPGHLKAYLVYACIFIVLTILLLIGVAVSGADRRSIGQNVFNILSNIYTTLIIRSQYFVMKSPERGPATYSAA